MADNKNDLKNQRDDGLDFDPDFSPDNLHNQEIARRLGLRYDSEKRSYVDEDGCLVRDRYGQPF